ncbi:MAG: thiamine ABC transporter substrate-binding protein [Spirochaetia bacterium]
MIKFFPLLLSILILFSCNQPRPNKLQILMPQTLRQTAEKALEEFAAQRSLNINQLYERGTGSIISRLTLEKVRPKTDIVAFLNRHQSEKIVSMYDVKRIEHIDTGYLAVVTREGIKIDTLKDLLNIVDQFAWLDPRTSSPGLDFLLWTYSVLPENDWRSFWQTVREKSKFFSTSWSEAYNWYSQGLVQGMVSYHTDQAYNIYYETNLVSKIQRLKEGWVKQSEYALLLKESPQAHQVMEFFLSHHFQSLLPLGNWVLPVNPTVTLPEVFDKYAPVITSGETVFDPATLSFDESESILAQFNDIWGQL